MLANYRLFSHLASAIGVLFICLNIAGTTSVSAPFIVFLFFGGFALFFVYEFVRLFKRATHNSLYPPRVIQITISITIALVIVWFQRTLRNSPSNS
jgi:uncharacterized membrane protein